MAPATEIERQLVEIWQEVLGLDRIGVHDHFFQLGGHALLATQVMNRLDRSLGLRLPLRSLFESPTVRALAGAAERFRAAGRPAPAPAGDDARETGEL